MIATRVPNRLCMSLEAVGCLSTLASWQAFIDLFGMNIDFVRESRNKVPVRESSFSSPAYPLHRNFYRCTSSIKFTVMK